MTISDKRLKEAARHYAKFCKVLDIDIEKADTIGTPLRVAKMLYEDFTVGQRDMPFKFTTFPVTQDVANQLVSVCGIRMVSMCGHHHLPFTGVCHVCYLPKTKLVGLSKIPRTIQWVARQPSMQEDILTKIRDVFVKQLDPRFIGVRIAAEHTCMSCRGPLDSESRTFTDVFWCESTSSVTGEGLTLTDFEPTRQEFYRNISEWYSMKGRA